MTISFLLFTVQPLVSFTFCSGTLFSWSLRNLVPSHLSPSLALLLQSLGKPCSCVSCSPLGLLPFAAVHTARPARISAVTEPCISAGSLPAEHWMLAAITQSLRGDSFAFSFGNSALISSHCFHSLSSGGKVFWWFSLHHAETFSVHFSSW